MKQARIIISLRTYILISILIASVLPDPTTATITTTGSVSPTYDSSDPWSTTNLYVGYTSDGSMLVDGGSDVSSSNGYVAYNTYCSDSSATITGTGSTWANSGYLYVGCSGDANMVVSDGGQVTSGNNSYIGMYAGSSGVVTVTGTDSLWANSEYLFIGFNGEGGLVVSDGGNVTNSIGCIGQISGSNGSATITGTDSLWANSDYLYVGYSGDANMVVSDGGNVTNVVGYIGYNSGGSGTVTVTGTDSLWANSGELYIGYSGNANMVVSNGGNVTNTIGYIGYSSGSSSVVTVTGPNSLWQSTSDLYIGGSAGGAGGTGLLDVNDSGTVQADNFYIWSTGTVSGDGYLSGNIWNYGTLEPGNSIGTLTIDGDLTMEPNSIYEVEVDNSGNSDLLSVTGDVNIVGGTVQAVSTETITSSQEYTIIEANSVTGTFDTLDTALLDLDTSDADTSLGYGSDSVLLTITALQFDDPNIVKTDNQRAVGGALQRIADGGGNSVTTAVQGLGTNAQVRWTYDQLSGQSRPQLAPVTIADTGKFMGTVSDRLHQVSRDMPVGFGSGPLLAMARSDSAFGNTNVYDVGGNGRNFAIGNGTSSFGNQKWGFWGRGYGLFGERDNESGVSGYEYTVYGTSFGLDYQFSESYLLGITGGYSDGDVDYVMSGSESEISGTHVGIYGSKKSNNWHFDSILTYSFLEYETERYINLLSQMVKGDFDGKGISGYLEARYDWRNLKGWLFQPLASFQFSYLCLDSYTETGGSGSLIFDDQSYESYKGSLGIKVTKELFEQDDNRSLQIQFRERWIHEFGDENSSVDASFATNPGTVFKVSDADVSRDSVVVGASLNARLSNRICLIIDYDLGASSDETTHLVSAALQYRR